MNLTRALRLNPSPTSPHVVTFVGAGGKTSALFRLADELTVGDARVVTTTTTRLFREQAEQSPAHLIVQNGQIDWPKLAHLLDVHGQVMLVTGMAETKAVGIAPALVDKLATDSTLGISAILVEGDGSRRRPIKAPADYEPVIPDSTTLLVPVMGLDAIGLPIAEPHVHRPLRMLSVLGSAEGTRLTPEMAARLLISPGGGAKGRPSRARVLPLLNKADRPYGPTLGRLIARRLSQSGQSSLVGQVGIGRNAPVLERHGPTAAVVLAAGQSSRMGEAKQLLQMDGEPLVVHAARTALESGATEVLVIVGAYAAEVTTVLAHAFRGRIRIVHNPHFAQGQSTSVLAALDALSAGWQAVTFLPVDQPNAPSSLLRRLIQQWRDGADLVAPKVNGEMRGAPALFDRRFESELGTVKGDRGAGPILKRRKAEVTTIVIPAVWLQDLDTPQSWQAYIGSN